MSTQGKTEGLLFIVIDGVYRVAQYCPINAEPSALGVDIVRFLRETFEKSSFALNMANVQHKTMPLDQCDHKDPVKLLHTIQHHHILATVPPVIYLDNYMEWAACSKQIRWGYVIDLDKHTFEVYKGRNKEEVADDERFAGWKSALVEDWKEGWRPIRSVVSWSLDLLPSSNKDMTSIIQQILRPASMTNQVSPHSPEVRFWMESGVSWF